MSGRLPKRAHTALTLPRRHPRSTKPPTHRWSATPRLRRASSPARSWRSRRSRQAPRVLGKRAPRGPRPGLLSCSKRKTGRAWLGRRNAPWDRGWTRAPPATSSAFRMSRHELASFRRTRPASDSTMRRPTSMQRGSVASSGCATACGSDSHVVDADPASSMDYVLALVALLWVGSVLLLAFAMRGYYRARAHPGASQDAHVQRDVTDERAETQAFVDWHVGNTARAGLSGAGGVSATAVFGFGD